MQYEYKIHLLFWVLVIILQGCTSDKVKPAPRLPATGCDALQVSYATCIKPVFKAYCYDCHSDSASQNGAIAFDMEDFSSLKLYLNNDYRGDSIYGSKFYHIILQTPGFIYMPPTGKVPENGLQLIKEWLNNGAPDN